MKISINKKAWAGVGLAGMLLLGGAPVLASSIAENAQDAANKQLDAGAIAALATPDCTFFSATNASVQTRVRTNNTPGFYTNSAAWADLACGSFSVTVPRGKSALAVVKTDAEVTCTAAAATDGQWCQGRVLINNVEGKPNAPEGDSFSWSNSQTDASAWESNAFSRTAYLRCPATTTTAVCTFPVKVQVKNHAAGLNFRVDDATVHAELTYF
jgi:hypothetical protein